MHTDGFPIGCVDCHGGNPKATSKEAAHVHPLNAEDWPKTGQLPVRSYSMLNNEFPEFVRFVNPSDLRAARLSCGGKSCHAEEVEHVRKSMMATGPMLWEAALYNNGEYPWKFARYGESYSENVKSHPGPDVAPAHRAGNSGPRYFAIPRPAAAF
jgi:hypothetical protein